MRGLVKLEGLILNEEWRERRLKHRATKKGRRKRRLYSASVAWSFETETRPKTGRANFSALLMGNCFFWGWGCWGG